MNTESYLAAGLRLLRTAALIDLVLFALVGLIGWFAGWRTVYEYSHGLVWAGAAAIGIGLFSTLYYGVGAVGYFQFDRFGNWNREISQQYVAEREKLLRDPGSGYAFLVRMILAGLIAIALGVLGQRTFA